MIMSNFRAKYENAFAGANMNGQAQGRRPYNQSNQSNGYGQQYNIQGRGGYRGRGRGQGQGGRGRGGHPHQAAAPIGQTAQ